MIFRLFVPAAIVALFVLGCGSSKEGASDKPPLRTSIKSEPLDVYEREFTPSKYDVDVAEVESTSSRYSGKIPDTTGATASRSMSLIPGFRVQVMFSGSIDEATRVKGEVAALFPTDNVYMIYDSPYYKVRLGDYQERSDATRALKVLLEKGYSQAWIVPDRVQSHPPQPALPPPPDIK